MKRPRLFCLLVIVLEICLQALGGGPSEAAWFHPADTASSELQPIAPPEDLFLLPPRSEPDPSESGDEEKAPPPATRPALVHDRQRGVSVLYVSPCTWDPVQHATWEYDGEAWSPIHTTRVPCLDQGYTMAYDAERGQTILLGLRSNYYAETWAYDGLDWTLLTTTLPCPNRVYGAAAYDQARQRLVFFGGKWCEKAGCVYADETSEYDGEDWRRLQPRQAPSKRVGHSMAYDEHDQVTLLFGGYGHDEQSVLGDTWQYDGRNWQKLDLAPQPPPRAEAAMAYDPERQVVVLFGGYGQDGRLLDDTWEYDGHSWRRVATPQSAAARAGHAMVYEQTQKALLLYGGRSEIVGQSWGDTWLYRDHNWSTVENAPQPEAPPSSPYPYCPLERPAGAGTLYIMPITDFGQNASGCGSGQWDHHTLCCGCDGPLNCPSTCWETGGNQDLLTLQDMRARLGAEHGNPNVQIGFSVPIFYLGFVDNDGEMNFNENILRYVLSLAVASDTPILIHLNGQQWAGSGWPGYGQLVQYLLEQAENNMHLVDPDRVSELPLPWYDEERYPPQDIFAGDINLTSPDLDWILQREFQYYKERNLKQALCWLHNFRAGTQGHLLAGISIDTESAMSSLYAAWPELEAWTDCGGQPCNYNPWDRQVSLDYQDQFDYRENYPDQCAISPAPAPEYCTGGMRHGFADNMLLRFAGNLDELNATMGTALQGWYGNHRVDSPDQLGDGYSVQNNPPQCQYDVAGYQPWQCVYTEQSGPVPYNQNYIDSWTLFRQKSVRAWLQRVSDWATCRQYPNENPESPYHLWGCPYADGAAPEGCEMDNPPGGFPARLVFTHQAADPEPREHFCSPIWTAQLTNTQVGLTAYDLTAASMASDSAPPIWHDAHYTTFFQQVADLADGRVQRDRWGLMEWNPIDWDCQDPGYAVHYQALENLYNCGANIICPYHWPDGGGNTCDGTPYRPYAIKDTSLQYAIHDFVLDHPFDPCQGAQVCQFFPLLLHIDGQAAHAVQDGHEGPERPAGISTPNPPAPFPDGSYPPPTPVPTPSPSPSPTPTPGDTTPPNSSIATLPSYQASPTFEVTWFGSDQQSGIALFEIQYRQNGTGPWQDWLNYPIPLFATFSQGQDGHRYAFRSRATDVAGNVEPWPAQPDAVTTVDLSPPASAVAELPPYSPGSIAVSWQGQDATSGLAGYDVQVCQGDCADPSLGWQAWLSATMDTTASFADVQDGQTYHFRCRARDNAGNIEAWPSAADAATTVDLLPPTSTVSELPAYSLNPMLVFWTGQDALSGIAEYDIQACRLNCTQPDEALWYDWITATTHIYDWFAGEDGPAYFRSRARDHAGNQEDYPQQAQASTVIDSQPPTSRVEPLPAYSRAPFAASWSGLDSGSGIASYDLQICQDNCYDPLADWQDWLSNTTVTTTLFEGAEHGHLYAFRCRARDRAGHVGNWPVWPQAVTTVDNVPPVSQVDLLPAYSPPTFTVTWSGTDDLAGIVRYDVQYCLDECAQQPGSWLKWLTAVTTTTALFAQGNDGHSYGFRVRATDGTGNIEPWPSDPDAATVVDGLPPSSQVHALPDYSRDTFQVSWSGADDGSGLAGYELQFCQEECGDPTADWSTWISTTMALSATFYDGQDGQTYHFRCRAWDQLGNIEPWPAVPDSATTVDTSPPDSQVQALPAYTTSPFTVTWTGHDDGSGVVSYDVQFCPSYQLGTNHWQDWLTGTTATSAVFAGHDQPYAFRCRAQDALGHQEAYPDAPDTQTRVDLEPPQTWLEAPIPMDNEATYLLRWAGQDNLSPALVYDVHVRDEAEANWQPWRQAVTETQAVFTGTAGHSYHFCVRGRDSAGNLEDKACPGPPGGWPIQGQVVIVLHPASWVASLPPSVPANAFLVHWVGSGDVSAYDVQVMDLAQGDWQDWLPGTTERSAWFSGLRSHTYAFRCRAVDLTGAGPLEPWPWGYDAITTIIWPSVQAGPFRAE
ncbi:MAG: hypothetical protein JXA37_08125 [Chloroflexia bacterium]|nr:hypothetical protein [Chloroflexia bacterium]